METPWGDSAEFECTEEQFQKLIAFFEGKKNKDMSGQLPTLNKPIHSNASKRNKSSKER